MSSGQREITPAVIEQSWCPGCRAVANRAVLRESRGDVIRIGCVVVARLMARYATGWQAVVLAAAMARRALLACMSPRQRKSRRAVTNLAPRP